MFVRLVLQALRPAAVELSLSATDDIQREAERLQTHRQQQLERARYEAERAERQYQMCEPDNRLVARELERRWEAALREHQRLTEEDARRQQDQSGPLSEADRQRVRALAADLPTLWETAGPADRKEIVRRLIDRVEVKTNRAETRRVTIRWAGGGISQYEVTRPVGSYRHLQDFDRLVARVQELRALGRMSGEIASTLNAEGFRTPRRDQRFTAEKVRQLVLRCGLRPRRQPVSRESVRLGPDERWMTDLATELAIPVVTLTAWCRKGWVQARKINTPEPRWAVWVGGREKERMRRLSAGRAGGLKYPYPVELTMPATDRKRESGARKGG
ncbi:MAG: hypothetical protein U0840_04125 [Gemmataceae bacterium]